MPALGTDPCFHERQMPYVQSQGRSQTQSHVHRQDEGVLATGAEVDDCQKKGKAESWRDIVMSALSCAKLVSEGNMEV